MLKLNLGCGHRILDGYKNYDTKPMSDKVIDWAAGEPLRKANGASKRLEDDSVDEILCTHMIEHIPHSPNEEIWFKFWEECWRVLKLGGKMFIVCPHGDSIWAWSDPGHTRAIYPEVFTFTAAKAYMENARMGTAMTPYNPCCNFSIDKMDITISDQQRMDGVKDERSDMRVLLVKEALPEGYLHG